MDLQERLTSFAMLGATWVMWVLIGLSVIAIAVMVERAYYLMKRRDDVARLRDEVVQLLGKGERTQAQKLLRRSPSFEAQIAVAGLKSSDDGAASAEERMAGASELARIHMERRLAFLGTVGNNAPFIGLLGTVIGVIRSFAELEQSGGKVSSGLMSEIGEALVATAIGILVAIPAVAAFNYFQRVIKSRLARASALGHEVLAYLKRAT